MTPAEMDTRRRALGLSIEEVATMNDVADRTVRRWHSGSTPPPETAIARLEWLEQAMEDVVTRIVRMATDRVESGPTVLTRYRTQEALDASPHAGLPLGAHAISIAWTADALAAEGVGSRIEWADEDER